MKLRAAVCGFMAAARLIELAFSRRNLKEAPQSVEGAWSRRIFPGLVALHTIVFIGTFVFGRRVRLPWLALLIAAQPLRAWVLLSLGRSWNAHGAVAADLEPVTTGPYARIRHPNYLVLLIELASLPAAFGLTRLAQAATLANALLLAARVHDEEAMLMQIPAYREHFAPLPRILPGL